MYIFVYATLCKHTGNCLGPAPCLSNYNNNIIGRTNAKCVQVLLINYTLCFCKHDILGYICKCL